MENAGDQYVEDYSGQYVVLTEEHMEINALQSLRKYPSEICIDHNCIRNMKKKTDP